MKFLIFPGQGSQYSGMGKDWYSNFQEARLVFEEASDHTGLNLKKLCFEGSESDLRATEITQPAILTTTVAVFRSLQVMAEGLVSKDDIFAGHSLGEYSALVCLGILDVGQAARLVQHRGQYMQEAVPAGRGSMAALIFKPKTDGSQRVIELCHKIHKDYDKKIWVANFNSPEQIVVSGEKSGIDKAIELATQAPTEARKAVELAVSAPFHCPMMLPAAERLKPELEQASWNPSQALTSGGYIANVDATLHNVLVPKEIIGRLVDQVTGSVRWVESVQTALSLGATEAIEVGPGKVLSGLIRRIELEGSLPSGQRMVACLECSNVDTYKDYHKE